MLLSIVYAVVRLLLDLTAARLRTDGAVRLELVVLRQEVRMLRRRAKRVGCHKVGFFLPPIETRKTYRPSF